MHFQNLIPLALAAGMSFPGLANAIPVSTNNTALALLPSPSISGVVVLSSSIQPHNTQWRPDCVETPQNTMICSTPPALYQGCFQYHNKKKHNPWYCFHPTPVPADLPPEEIHRKSCFAFHEGYLCVHPNHPQKGHNGVKKDDPRLKEYFVTRGENWAMYSDIMVNFSDQRSPLTGYPAGEDLYTRSRCIRMNDLGWYLCPMPWYTSAKDGAGSLGWVECPLETAEDRKLREENDWFGPGYDDYYYYCQEGDDTNMGLVSREIIDPLDPNVDFPFYHGCFVYHNKKVHNPWYCFHPAELMAEVPAEDKESCTPFQEGFLCIMPNHPKAMFEKREIGQSLNISQAENDLPSENAFQVEAVDQIENTLRIDAIEQAEKKKEPQNLNFYSRNELWTIYAAKSLPKETKDRCQPWLQDKGWRLCPVPPEHTLALGDSCVPYPEGHKWEGQCYFGKPGELPYDPDEFDPKHPHCRDARRWFPWLVWMMC